MFDNPQAREKARALVGAAALGSTVGLAIGGAYLAGGLARATVVHAEIQRLAGAASGGFSETALTLAASAKDDAVLAIARRHDPGLLGDSERDRQAAALVDRLEARRAQGGSMVLAAAPKPKAPAVIKVSAAQPFHLRGALEQSRDLECLTQAVYYEARGESRSGQKAVAQVILNRVRHPSFPKTVCGVVFQGVRDGGCQFSFACDGQPHHPLENAAWRRSESVAAEALEGQVMAEVGDATHFHAAGRSSAWSVGLSKVAQVGAHVFYRFAGRSAKPPLKDVELAEAGTPRPVFASLSLAGGGKPSTSAQLLADASAAMEHAAVVVENAAKGVAAAEVRATTPKPPPAAPEAARTPAAPGAPPAAPAP